MTADDDEEEEEDTRAHATMFCGDLNSAWISFGLSSQLRKSLYFKNIYMSTLCTLEYRKNIKYIISVMCKLLQCNRPYAGPDVTEVAGFRLYSKSASVFKTPKAKSSRHYKMYSHG